MDGHNFSPVEVHLLLHVYAIVDPAGDQYCSQSATGSTFSKLERMGLVVQASPTTYGLTASGNAVVEHILSTPIPRSCEVVIVGDKVYSDGLIYSAGTPIAAIMLANVRNEDTG